MHDSSSSSSIHIGCAQFLLTLRWFPGVLVHPYGSQMCVDFVLVPCTAGKHEFRNMDFGVDPVPGGRVVRQPLSCYPW